MRYQIYLLKDVPLNERLEMIWQQNGGVPDNSNRVTQFLNNKFPYYWIIWGYLKEL